MHLMHMMRYKRGAALRTPRRAPYEIVQVERPAAVRTLHFLLHLSLPGTVGEMWHHALYEYGATF